MPRTITSALQTELSKQITSVGYLMQINGSQILRWTDIGDVTYNSVPWVGVDMDITGLKLDPDRDPECDLSVQNLDSAVAALFLTEAMADVTVDLYQFARGALATGDAAYMFKLVFDSMQIKVDRLTAHLSAYSSLYAFSPRRRVEVSTGFSYALPRGTQIAWGNEIFIVEPDNA